MLLGWLGRQMLPMLAPDDGAPQGGGESPAPRTKTADLVTQYNGDVSRMADKLAEVLDDNYKLRTKNNDLKRDNDDLKTKVAPDGALILTADEASQYQSLKALNLKPDEITKRLTDADAAVSERDTLKRRDTIRQVADVSGYKSAVLERLGADLVYEIKDATETVNGKQVQTKQVLVKDGEKNVPLKDYAAREWQDFLPALGGTEPGIVQGTPRRDAPRGTPPTSDTPAPINIRL